ncbi:mercuric transporter MerT family protein [Mariprofundus micogutta]|uniref:mercuric transporter MerT family protein n=1 Tax=Mariprofundus micogutta TaxID=1921010 RepID=UPI000932BBD2|nr:mercuric transporter MerT family protein [Mariprofundus micogutta]
MTDSFSKKVTPSLLGAMMAGFLASACCLGPLVLLLLGFGSASAFIALEPYRPLFAVITFGLLGWAVWQYRRNSRKCLEKNCNSVIRPMGMWLFGVLALLMLFSPSIIPLFTQ